MLATASTLSRAATYIHKPAEFTERKSLAALLENVDKAACWHAANWPIPP